MIKQVDTMDSRSRPPPPSSGRGGGGGDDDARKKRDSTQVVQEPKEHDNEGENPKKVRLDKSELSLSSSSATTTKTKTTTKRTAIKTLVATPAKALNTKAATSSSTRKLPPTTSTASTSKSDDSVFRKASTIDIPDRRATKTIKSDIWSRNEEDDGNNHTVDTSSNHSIEPEHASRTPQQKEIEPKQLPTEPQVLPPILDIESALHCLVQVEHDIHGSGVGGGCHRRTSSNSVLQPTSPTTTTVKEYLSKSTHVTFCVGHAGDASTIASFYRLSQQRPLHQEEVIEEESPEQLKSAISTRQPTSQRPLTSPAISSVSALVAHGPGTATNESKCEANGTEPSLDAGSAAASSHPVHLDTTSSSTSTTATTEGDESPGMLELWLADGLGDEDTPPSVFCLLAYVSSDDTDTTSPASQTTGPGPEAATTPQTLEVSTLPAASGTSSHHSPPQLGAVAVLTVAWAAHDDKVGGGVSGEVGCSGGGGGGAYGGRMLRVEWFQVNHLLRLESPEVASVLQRRMWLRLSILSRLTGCQLLLVNSWSGDDNVLATTRVKQKSIGNGAGAPGVVPSAE
jgi:hypothetical protein